MPNVEPKHIRGLAAVPQALDDQWVPQATLRRGAGRATEQEVRAEYRRALLNADHVILNRAYLWNSPVVFGDFAGPDDDGPAAAEREAFVGLANGGAIVPFLTAEEDPWVPPEFDRDGAGVKAWDRMRVHPAFDPHCLRLSWDDTKNATRYARTLTSTYGSRCATLPHRDPAQICSDLGLDLAEEQRLHTLLHEVAAAANDEALGRRPVTRSWLYKRFLTAGADPTVAPPPRDPVRQALKELLDLTYNSNLPDALLNAGARQTFLLTPGGSPSRLVLQEHLNPGDDTDADQLADLVAGIVLDEALDQIVGPAFSELTLHELARARASAEWAQYMASARRLVASQRGRLDPAALTGPDGLSALYGEYHAVIDRIAVDRHADVEAGRAESRVDAFGRWSPRIKLVLAIGSRIVEILPGEHFRVLGLAIGATATAALASDLSSVRAVIEGDREGGDADLDMSIDLASLKVEDAAEAEEAVIQTLRDRGFEQIDGEGREAEVVNDPNLAAG